MNARTVPSSPPGSRISKSGPDIPPIISAVDLLAEFGHSLDIPDVGQAAEVLTVTLRPVPGVLADIPLQVRFRGALKVLLRRFGLRASWPTPTATPSTPAASSDRLHPHAAGCARIDGKRNSVHPGFDVQAGRPVEGSERP